MQCAFCYQLNNHSGPLPPRRCLQKPLNIGIYELLCPTPKHRHAAGHSCAATSGSSAVATSCLKLSVELIHAQALAHPTQLRHFLRRRLHRRRLLCQQVSLNEVAHLGIAVLLGHGVQVAQLLRQGKAARGRVKP